MNTIDWTHLEFKYAGKWVAFGEDHETVISDSTNLKTTLSRAKKLGYSNPLIFKVPDQATSYVG